MPASSSTTELLYVPDWAARAEARLLRGWDAPRIRAFVRSLAKGAQLQEDQSFDLLVSTTLENATGQALDQWGEIVGEQRQGLSDADFRPFIKARMLVNRTASTIDEMLEILETCAAPVVRCWHEDNQPAGAYLVVERRAWMAEPMRRRVSRLMEQARPAGRHLTVIETVPGAFGFLDDTGASGLGVGPLSRLVLPLP